jgi:hypothetical protein
VVRRDLESRVCSLISESPPAILVFVIANSVLNVAN